MRERRSRTVARRLGELVEQSGVHRLCSGVYAWFWLHVWKSWRSMRNGCTEFGLFGLWSDSLMPFTVGVRFAATNDGSPGRFAAFGYVAK